jgi:hypothetical protein
MSQSGNDRSEEGSSSLEPKEENNGCIRNIEKKVRIEAEVIIKPRVVVVDSELEADCCDRVQLKSCKKDEYTFVVSQGLNLTIPLRFDAEVEVKNKGVQCNKREDEQDDRESKRKSRMRDIDPGWMID